MGFAVTVQKIIKALPSLLYNNLMISRLFNNIRFYVLLISVLIAVYIFIWADLTTNSETGRVIRLTQTYALIAITYLYLALLASPLTKFFKFLPYRGQYIKARRAIGVSAFFFGLIHAYFAFFGELSGFAGLPFLTDKYLIAVSLSATALTILLLMASTSFDFVISKLTHKRWKMLHRLVYLAGILLIIHALMLGSHFQDLSGIIPQVFFTALIFLLILESLRLDEYLAQKFPSLPRFGLAMILSAFLIGGAIFYYLVPSDAPISLGIHSEHLKLATEANNQTSQQNSKIPGLQGDRTKRFTVDFNHPETLSPNQDIPLTFKVFDASNGSQVQLFNLVYEKNMHLIIVNSELNYYEHIHPEQKADSFQVTTRFPKAGQYKLYIDFQPIGAIEQQFAFTLNIGASQIGKNTDQPDQSLTKTFGSYQVSLEYPRPLRAQELSFGQKIFKFTIKDASNDQPVTTLRPYLASFGHLVMIKQDTYEYIHVHPNRLIAPRPNENGGPTVEFMPIGIYGPIKPGIYKVFTQFNPNNELILTDFTIEVE